MRSLPVYETCMTVANGLKFDSSFTAVSSPIPGVIPVPVFLQLHEVLHPPTKTAFTMSRRSLCSLALALVLLEVNVFDKTVTVTTARKVTSFPDVNAAEVYKVVKAASVTDPNTVTALRSIQSSYRFNLNWVNDPCTPVQWERVNCSSLSVISLDLSNMNLSGIIAPAFGDLIDLQSLDLHNNSLMAGIENILPLIDLQVLNLSYNSLSGSIPNLTGMNEIQELDLQSNKLGGTLPASLGSLSALQDLNVENNDLKGPIPESLNKSSLNLRTSGNPCIDTSCSPPPPPVALSPPSPPSSSSTKSFPPPPGATSTEKDNHTAPIVGGLVGGAIALVVIIGILFISLWRRNKKKMQPDSRREGNENLSAWNGAKRFSLKEIKKATSNFKEPIGQGSFGLVYLGRLADGQQVAVKVRSDASQLGSDSFVNEVFLLSQVQHSNLVSLTGFCQESKQQILIYEYLPGGNFTDYLYGDKAKKSPLVWRQRLRIVVGAAIGLQYLHGHNPKIIHRDVKTNNILLDAAMNAKVSDFGLSKHLTKVDATHVTTLVKGTAGYLDPEYYATQQLTEKSDVYGFGVALLEIICGREPLSQNCPPDQYNLVFWAKPLLEAGSFSSVVDKSIENGYNLKSMEIVTKLAVRCVDRVASKRPTMEEVLGELKSALAIEEEVPDRF